MMNGYSVTEAASVLGVPTERVWELLARGVLAGAPEGETGMRVFLQPRQAAAPITATEEPSAASNGPDRELSPFRELLTEFRNLTERYGQALLALGESRGEVASLRSRVDLLEARIDLRLPMGGAPPSSPWPTQPLPVRAPIDSAPSGEATVEHEEEAHRRRARGARRATESFAEAMARTEDPSPADLPPSAAAGAVLESEDADRSLPRDALPAEPMLVADAEEDASEPAAFAEASEPIADEPGPSVADLEPVVAPAATDEIEEPVVGTEPAEGRADHLVEADVSGLAGGAVIEDLGRDDAGRPDVEPVAEDAQAPESTEVSVASDESDEFVEGDSEPADLVAEETQPDKRVAEGGAFDTWSDRAGFVTGTEDELAPTGVDEPVTEAADAAPSFEGPPADQAASDGGPAADESETVIAADSFDAERYSTVIEQPDWFEAEADDDWQTAPATGETGVADDRGDDDDRGADEMEVAGGGHAGPAPAEARTDEALPGARELDEALDAYGDLGRRTTGMPEAEGEWPPTRSGEGPMSSTPYRPTGFGDPSRRTYGSVTPSGPANRAYRRLRRIFPT
jgi:hypothetical protein